MILADVNVLVHAFRQDSTDHERYRAWLEGVINGPAAYGIAPQVLSSLVRITTNRRVFAQPSSLEEALAFSRVLLEQPNATIVTPGARHWTIFEEVCRAASATGNLVPDAWFAALALEWDCEWITLDRDYARFAGLRWRPPW